MNLGVHAMPDKYDPYREALVMETQTVWPEEYEDVDPVRKQEIARALHADPESCANLTYLRTHTGFCREITVTPEDVERVS